MGKSETKTANFREGRARSGSKRAGLHGLSVVGPVFLGMSLVLYVALAQTSDAGVREHGRAHAASSIAVTDTAHMTLAHNDGEYITEEGQAHGTIPGHVRALLIVGPVVRAKFTIYASGGTISGEGSGRPKGRSEEPSFQGAMSVSQGTGRYKGAHGRGSFYGQLNRRSYKMYVSTSGTLYY
jgi:hypothetical protein